MVEPAAPSSNELVVATRDGAVAIIRLNRPHVRNALNQALFGQIVATVEAFAADPEVRAMVITGDDRAFAAGADIAEMADASVVEMHRRPNLARWEVLRRVKVPLIAAVNGFALGGGCELAMVCDMIVASESAKFGQPEINLGIIPGGGGTQRLVHAVGKARAMEMILTGRIVASREMLAAGLLTSVVPDEQVLVAAVRLAHEIAAKPPLAVELAKESVLKAYDVPLATGLEFERRSFNVLFATDDRREGMRAFLEKRKPKFTGN